METSETAGRVAGLIDQTIQELYSRHGLRARRKRGPGRRGRHEHHESTGGRTWRGC